MASIKKRETGKWRARYRDDAGKEHARHFDGRSTRSSGSTSRPPSWSPEPTSRRGRRGRPWGSGATSGSRATAATGRRPSGRPRCTSLGSVSRSGPCSSALYGPSHVRTWAAQLAAEGLADSYVYALHARLAQLFADAVHDGLVAKSPCSRRTSPTAGKQRAYVATTEQVWALHDAMPEHLRPAVLLGAFAGLRLAEACGLRVADVDFMRGIVAPAVQYPAEPLKTETSQTPVPIPQTSRARAVGARASPDGRRETVLVERAGPPARARGRSSAPCGRRGPRCRVCRPGFRYHDLRHYFASLLIASGADVKVVQARLRHASAKTTLDTYGHLWPDSDDSTRAAIEAVMAARADSLRTAGGGDHARSAGQRAARP